MLKKAGLVTIGVSAALLTASPMAFAGNSDYDHGNDNDKGHHGHHKSHGEDKGGWANTSCKSQSGDVDHNKGEGALAIGSILDGNSGQLLSCNSFLNNNLNHNSLDVL